MAELLGLHLALAQLNSLAPDWLKIDTLAGTNSGAFGLSFLIGWI